MPSAPRPPGFQVLIGEEPATLLVAERLRDGRVAIGTRVRGPNGEWEPGELHFLDPAVQLDLAAWLTPGVENEWLETARQRSVQPLKTAGELYGEGPGAVTRFAFDTLAEIPPHLLGRAMLLLANALGPRAHDRLVERLNATENVTEDSELRRQIADENEAFAYAIAAAALFDSLDRGVYPEDVE